MLNELVKFKLIHPGATLPTRGTDGSGGFDFYAPEDGELKVGEKKLIPTGVAHELPGPVYLALAPADAQGGIHGAHEVPFRFQGILFDRSGLGGKKGVRLSFACLIDNDYRGDILLSIENQGPATIKWETGNRLCQIAYVLMYAGGCSRVDELSDTKRGVGGFGSTGGETTSA